jgi:site-specific DNA-methyltransferase (adenine-specific)
MWAELKRLIKPNGAIVLFGSQPFTSALIMSNIKWFKYCWVWRKGRFANQLLAKIQPLKTHEDIIIFSEKTTKYNPQGLMKVSKLTRQGGRVTDCNGGGSRRKQYLQEFSNYPRSILEFASEGCTVHPTQKPVALFEYLIKTYTNEGDLILDNCAGSGTTAVAAINTNRNYILMEKEAKYIDVINQRLGNHEPSPVLTFPPQPQQLSLFA